MYHLQGFIVTSFPIKKSACCLSFALLLHAIYYYPPPIHHLLNFFLDINYF
jgi:hypothetical protein